ncbi:hypothetical protein B0T10DRAFT_596896 [Thelonectria olida]|uniref:Nucleoside phosphorylase domain-containing protein n=1 Tax=Thelonectria olida TaxID=1576542 RepID=A0A9P8VP67_9HYPO|nr:hypothetical protein B0T10DRAFT_596896 [Thelonectria olida]
MSDSELDEKPSFPPDQYTIGWICALPGELRASRTMLDQEHGNLMEQPKHDANNYVLGTILGHNVAMLSLPMIGTNPATSAVKSMRPTFPNLRFVLMVGIGGGIPSKRHDIRLGDVVVSQPDGQGGGVVQYDLGWQEEDGFCRLGSMNMPPQLLLSTVNTLQSDSNPGRSLSKRIKAAADKCEEPEEWDYLGVEQDRLFEPEYPHPGDEPNCEKCSEEKLIKRTPRKVTSPKIHYGNIGSGNRVIKSATERDLIAKKENVICFEMEAAGLMNEFPCLVIRGISDYADSHKNRQWQPYAAIAAAAYARSLLRKISTQSVENLEPLKKVVQEIKTGIVQTSKTVNTLLRAHQNDEESKILEWLTTVDYAPQHNDVFRQRQAGTGQWFLDSHEFKTWVAADRQTLFCPGIPGSGKTMMTAIVIDHLCRHFHRDPTIGIAYIYCSFRMRGKQRAEDLLLSLLRQLAERHSSLPEIVKDLSNKHKNYRTRPPISDIAKTIHSVCSGYSKVFIIIDALDECDGPKENLARFLGALFPLRDQAGVNIFATSRFNDEGTRFFKECPSREISAASGDILKHIQDKMQHLNPDHVAHNMREMIEKGVVEAASGMFLLAKLQTDSLLSQLTKGQLKTALKALGKGEDGLDDTYDQTMERIENQRPAHKHMAFQALQWIANSKWPLSVPELLHALAIQKKAKYLDPDDVPTTNCVLSLCGGLVIHDKESNIIRLVHYTAQQYFERNDRWFPNAASALTTGCLTYLSFDAFSSGVCRTNEELEQRLKSNPFYNYASRNWGTHALESSLSSRGAVVSRQMETRENEIHRLIVSFFEATGNLRASAQVMLTVFNNRCVLSQITPRIVTGLHIAAFFGLSSTIGRLLRDGNAADPADEWGRTPLSWAAEQGHEAVVELLLATRKVNVNSKHWDFNQTPLLWAAANGHENVVQLLLQAGAQPDLRDSDDQTPLTRAIEGGFLAAVRVLLERGAEVNYRYVRPRFALHRLQREKELEGFEECLVPMLPMEFTKEGPNLPRAAEPMASLRDMYPDTFGQPGSIFKSLERLVPIFGPPTSMSDFLAGTRTPAFRTPVSRAAELGYKAIVKILLDNQARVDLVERENDTAPTQAIASYQ